MPSYFTFQLGSCSVAGTHLLTEVAVCGGSWRVSPPRRPPLCRQLSSPPPANKKLGFQLGSCSVAGAHLLTEVAVCGGSWRVSPPRRPPLCRQLSSPPPANKVRRDVRRVVSADASSALQRQASCVRRFLRPRPLARWTPRPLRRLLSSDSDTVNEDQDHQENGRTDESAMESTFASITSNGVETAPVTNNVMDKEPARHVDNECSVWLCYIRACGWWGAGGAAAAAGAQLLAVAADCWLAYITTENAKRDITREQMWQWMSGYAFWCGGGLFLAGLARALGGAAGGAARRVLHERLLHATLHAPLAHHHATPVGFMLHRLAGRNSFLSISSPLCARRAPHERLLHATLHAPLAHHHATPVGFMLHRFSHDVHVVDSPASLALYERLLHATLHAPLAHHHATPVGFMLHRFSHDVHVVDSKLPTAVTRWAQLALTCIAAALVSVAAAPWSLLALAPAAALYLTLQGVYLRNARELQCEEARSAAPIVSLAGETGAGGATIRAARLQRQLRTNFLNKLDNNHNALLLLNAANRWLGLTMDLVGAAAVCVSLAVSAWCGGGGGAGGALAGLAGAHALLLPLYLAHLAKCRADLALHLAAVERLVADTNVPQEDYRDDSKCRADLALHLAAVERLVADTNVPQEDYRDDCPIPAGWKRDGRISFEDVSVTHEPGAPPALTHVQLAVQPGEKVAICGRSGSGKSTLLMSCVGATSISRGRVLIDGQDATLVPLRALRHRLVVLPQEATLFSTTLRENLDPLGVHTDMEIWSCLRVVGLYEFVAAQSAGLECMVASTGGGGGAWSAGRRARACAARAVLRAPLAAALLLDEPGAALDAPNEQALLAAVARAAPNTTLLTVAHRMSSVSGYDRCVVVERGSAVEQPPSRPPRPPARDA
ncbi:unnamed protein product [Plutella xylostella]|uniref:(diamondback moth) hypothetical protein n=1 Tax=Plutella xylostella TaxID=51655 RepID=A0A8S4DCQ3_PLUXY|nr:unnamed protein product [Plutella xylostella]